MQVIGAMPLRGDEILYGLTNETNEIRAVARNLVLLWENNRGSSLKPELVIVQFYCKADSKRCSGGRVHLSALVITEADRNGPQWRSGLCPRRSIKKALSEPDIGLYVFFLFVSTGYINRSLHHVSKTQ